MRYVRVPAEATIDNPDQPPIWIDIIIGDGEEMIGQHELSGVLGRFTQTDVQIRAICAWKGRQGRLG